MATTKGGHVCHASSGLAFAEGTFSSRYQRNNRGGGLKNLQCFPQCRTGEHRATTFCGNSIVLSVRKPVSQAGLAYAVFGEFRQATDRALCDLHATVQLSAIQDNVIGQDGKLERPMKSVYAGSLAHADSDQGPLKAEFLPFRWSGWHYSWVSHRSTMNTDHYFRVYLLQTRPDGTATCVDMVDSTPFQVRTY